MKSRRQASRFHGRGALPLETATRSATPEVGLRNGRTPLRLDRIRVPTGILILILAPENRRCYRCFLRRNGKRAMGEIHADVTLENPGDPRRRRARTRPGIRHPSFDHRCHRRYGSRHAGSAAERGGTPGPGATGYRAFLTYADERREERPLAGPVTVRIGNRSMSTDCVVGPAPERTLDRPGRPRNPRI